MPGRALPPELIPLEVAARDAQRRAYPEANYVGDTHERLNGLAHAMAALVPLFTLSPQRRMLTADEVARGHFRGGASSLHFIDGRAPITELAVSAESVDRFVESILAAK